MGDWEVLRGVIQDVARSDWRGVYALVFGAVG